MKCNHDDFLANVRVDKLDSGHIRASLTIKCNACGVSFRFLGLPAGVDLSGASVSVDGTEARLAIGTNETVVNIIESPSSVLGYTVKKK